MKFLPKAALTAALVSCAIFPPLDSGIETAQAHLQSEFSGAASYYGGKFHGRTTANGERFDMNAMTAAHRTLPFDTRLRVTNRDNGKTVVVRINDRGPYAHGRVIDLSQGAAAIIGMIEAGVTTVDVEVVA